MLLERRILLFAGATLLSLAGATLAGADKPPPASPKPLVLQKPALFQDDFSGDLSKWRPDKPGVWSIANGMLRAVLPNEKQQRSIILAGSAEWTDYAVDLDICGMRGVDKGVIFRMHGKDGVGADLRGGEYQDLVVYRGWIPLGRVPAANGNGKWSHMRVEARERRYRVFVNGKLVIDKQDSRDASASGGIALPAYTGGAAECHVYYDNVVVTALD